MQTIAPVLVFDPFLMNLTVIQQLEDGSGEPSFHGRFVELQWDLEGAFFNPDLDRSFCAFTPTGEEMSCAMTLSRMIPRVALESFDGNCTEPPEFLTMRGFSGGPYFNASQGFGAALELEGIVNSAGEELTWKGDCWGLIKTNPDSVLAPQETSATPAPEVEEPELNLLKG